YSSVAYDGLTLSAAEVAAPAPTGDHPPLTPRDPAGPGVVTASVTVRNGGDRPAEELVQVYSLGAPGTDSPERLRLGYRRVRLDPGGIASAPVDQAELGHGTAPSDGAPGLLDGDLRVPAATYTVAAGASSTDLPVRGELTVTGATA
ncbi:hypothetical protein ACFT1B_36495, partial [Streptomyces griseoincarnatus]